MGPMTTDERIRALEQRLDAAEAEIKKLKQEKVSAQQSVDASVQVAQPFRPLRYESEKREPVFRPLEPRC